MAQTVEVMTVLGRRFSVYIDNFCLFDRLKYLRAWLGLSLVEMGSTLTTSKILAESGCSFNQVSVSQR